MLIFNDSIVQDFKDVESENICVSHRRHASIELFEGFQLFSLCF
jgi:hypothetical protein